jgi:hypothetical protein
MNQYLIFRKFSERNTMAIQKLNSYSGPAENAIFIMSEGTNKPPSWACIEKTVGKTRGLFSSIKIQGFRYIFLGF